MNEIIINTLYKNNPARFQRLKAYAKEFNAAYNGNNIIQDDIFGIVRNYVAKNDNHIELLRLPVKDDDFCAFTCIRNGNTFTTINSALPVCKQIFAAGHELYHIWCNISNRDESLSSNGSLLTEEKMGEAISTKEDMEANAFAALLLVPSSALNEQIDIYGIDQKKIDLDAVVRLMDIFAVPYKAMVLRVFEEGMISERTAVRLLEQGTTENIEYSMQKQNIAMRWQKSTPYTIDMGTLPILFQENIEAACLPEKRIAEDKNTIKEISDWFAGK